MNIIIIYNGLGNQMSQYAFYLQKKEISNSTYNIVLCKEHNGLELNKVFGISFKENFFQKLLTLLFKITATKRKGLLIKMSQYFLRIFNCKLISENFDYRFNNSYFNNSKGINFYLGGWHSEKYFFKIQESIKITYNFKIPNDIENDKLANTIISKNSVSIHIRRGDYLTEDNLDLIGDIANKAYFEEAISLMIEKLVNPHFFVFSNDMDWVKENLAIPDVTYVTVNKAENSWKDMYLMHLCKHNIISNSSFSWWGAWLNKNKNKIVVSPSKFLKTDIVTDVYPEPWIKLNKYESK